MVSSVQIGVRVRPPIQNNQIVEDVIINAVPKTKQIIVSNQHFFTTDYAFSIDTTQSYLYDTCVLPQVNHLLEGEDVSVIVFGKSGSGKTFSLYGPGLSCDVGHGIVPRAARHIFNTLIRWQQQKGLQFKVSISFFEILNGEVNDLISTTNQSKEFELRVNDKGSTVISGVESIECLTVNEVFGCLKLVLQHRKAAWTKYVQNCEAHLFFLFSVQQEWAVGDQLQCRVSTGTFIELSSCQTGAFNGYTFPQNNNKDVGFALISKLLYTLTSCSWTTQMNISPFLLALLKDAFTASMYTLLLCCLTPSTLDCNESLRYLQLVDKFRMVFGQQKLPEEDALTITTSQELGFETDDSLNKPDAFALEFAASQWQKLVVNAEGLFSKLVKRGLSKDSKQQIEQWLFLKQEYEECLSNEASISNRERESHSLDRIDEVTESDGGSSGEEETEYSESGELSSYDSGEDLHQSSPHLELKNRDFQEKLAFLMEKFCQQTDMDILDAMGPLKPGRSKLKCVLGSSDIAPVQASPLNSFNAVKNQRRKSIVSLGVAEAERQMVSESVKKESSLTSQSKKKLKKLLKQLRKDDDQQSLSLEKDGSKDKRKNSREEKERKLSKEEKRSSVKNSEEERRELCLVERRNSGRWPNQEGEDKLREEITNLRKTRDFLVDQRRGLDTKLNRDRSYTKTEERKFIELDEAIEAIDATIEFKNGAICGRSGLESREESEQLLIDRLMRLNDLEIRSLLCKYFKKTVDLREAGRKLEEQISEMDQRVEAQQWKIAALTSALHQARLENERRLVTVTREHEEKLHLMFRHYTGSSSSAEASEQPTGASPRAVLAPGHQAIPQQNLRKLGGTLSGHTTKVTRVKNKLIIQQSSKKASS